MEKKGILDKVTKPTDWVNSAVYVKKPGKLRVCLDRRELNKHIKIPKFRLPTMDDVILKLGKGKVFTVLDAKDGFLQVKQDEKSSKLSTFYTPFGRYKWLRMPFGTCSVAEEFQRHVQNVIEGLNGVETIADDLLVDGIGTIYEEAVIDHDNNLIDLVQRCRERNFKLNLSKLKFKQQKVKYNVHIFTADGILLDPDKVEVITKMPRPRDKAEVRRFFSMINYMAKFLPKLFKLPEPLRNLTKEETQFILSDVQEDAFSKLKKVITEPPLLRYYDLEEEVTIESDSSDYGMRAVLLQAGRPVAFASRTLTERERHYSQIEKECLALVFSSNRFDHYLHGKKNITALTDHKLLETILRKSIKQAPKRLQRMMLRLQKYHLNAVYKKGRDMHISDHLSRSALSISENIKLEEYDIFSIQEENELMQDIKEIDPDLYHDVSDRTLLQVPEATVADDNLMTLAEMVTYGWPDDKSQVPPNIREYWPYRDELAVQRGILYRVTCVTYSYASRHVDKNTLSTSWYKWMHQSSS